MLRLCNHVMGRQSCGLVQQEAVTLQFTVHCCVVISQPHTAVCHVTCLFACRAANAWRMCMVLSSRLQQSQQQQQALAKELAEQLQASGSGADAAQLLAQYLGDIDGAVAALVAAREWREGLRVAYAAGRQDLVDTTVVPGAAQVGVEDQLYDTLLTCY
jgi:hypothetical protein